MAVAMDSTAVITVGEAQLRLLWGSSYQVGQVLAQLMEPRNPSEVARLLGWPANRAHYWVGRLHGAGLVVRVASAGRRHYYRVAAVRYRVPLGLLPLLTLEVPANPARAAARLMRGLTADGYRWLGALSEAAVVDERTGERYVEIELRDRLVVHAYQPAMQTLRMRLSSRGYARLVNRLTSLLAELGEEAEAEGELCTLAVVGYREP